MGGRLQAFLPQWEKMTSLYIWNLVSNGYEIEFAEAPPRRYFVVDIPKNPVKALAMKNLVQDLILLKSGYRLKVE